jgi:hypothetical protein
MEKEKKELGPLGQFILKFPLCTTAICLGILNCVGTCIEKIFEK